MIRERLTVRGVVQGVGFRPHVARLAAQLGVHGECRNDATCVVIEVEGGPGEIAAFRRRLVAEAPPLARIDEVHADGIPTCGATDFVIAQSTTASGERTLVPPDTAVCADCMRELTDPADRRYRHPFITCTNCGPRLSIIEDLPYDRTATTMAGFAMCAKCTAEYADPLDRRYHAQPIGCHDCGPRLSYRAGDVQAERAAALAGAVTALAAGQIIAIKGIGGYHLACDATNQGAVLRLRERKQRPAQPFALMVADARSASTVVSLTPTAETLLCGPERPIVLLPAARDTAVADAVAPGLDEIGVMLAYAPVHHLLLADLRERTGRDPVLVMTSGNLSGEPMCSNDSDAYERLADIADGFLSHDRPIAVPVEDSVTAWAADGPVPIRRSRGYAPLPVELPGTEGVVLAAGAELKNTVALSSGGRAFVSAHIGDLESLRSRQAHERVTEQLLRFHRAAPELVVADRHPGYASRAWATHFADDRHVPVLEVQHHHAHLASLAAEHGCLDQPLLGWVLDGTGYGCDGGVWGCELLLLREGGTVADRLGWLGEVRLPGGDAGVRNPARTAAVALLDAGMPVAGTRVGAELTAAELGFLMAAATSGHGLVSTSSAGRLFDVVSALLGVCSRVSYEAQAAIELESVARSWRLSHPAAAVPDLPFPVVDGPLRWLDPGPLVRALGAVDGEPGAAAYGFHLALARATADLAAQVAADHGLETVGLSGGVYVNRLLLAATARALRDQGLRVLRHERVPANDGGLALGQVAVGTQVLARARARAEGEQLCV